ncbi:uncharacterized protein METZ01_LOCUS500677, partial [marine metagenome]
MGFLGGQKMCVTEPTRWRSFEPAIAPASIEIKS